jgi:hypothetical protein
VKHRVTEFAERTTDLRAFSQGEDIGFAAIKPGARAYAVGPGRQGVPSEVGVPGVRRVPLLTATRVALRSTATVHDRGRDLARADSNGQASQHGVAVDRLNIGQWRARG